MITENKEYSSLVNRIEAIRSNALNTKLTIGKHKGETFEEIMSYDKQYIYWVIRETDIDIDPRTLGLEMPTKESILKLLDLTFKDNEFRYYETIVHPAIYDSWNVGHYGCTSPECIKKEITEIHAHTYTFDELLKSDRFEVIKNHYPYIKWTKNYLVSLFDN